MLEYEDMLRNKILPAIRRIIEDNFLIHSVSTGQRRWTALYVVEAKFLRHGISPRWIGRKEEIEWPPRSPDLSPLDYSL